MCVCLIAAWLKYQPIVALPPRCSWEDEGDELPELPEWKPLSPLPSPMESAAVLAMETDSSSVEREYRLLLL